MAALDNSFTSIEWFINNSFMGRPSKTGASTGFLKTSRFKVEFLLPFTPFTPQTRNEIQSFLQNNIYSISMPPVTVSTTVTPLRWQIGRRSEEETLTMTFFESPNLAVRNSMWTWIDKMVTRRTDTNNWAREYLDDVKATITIRPVELDGKFSTRAAILTYAIPTGVQPIDFNISQGENEAGKTAVTFKYRFQEMTERSSRVDPFG